MVSGRPELGRESVLEHGTSRSGRWLRDKRVRLAFGLAVVEGLLVAFDVIDGLIALLVALLLLLFYFSYGRKLRWDWAREASWVAATSQAFVALVPVLVIVIGTLAIIGVAVIAVVALVLLFADRR
jgi:uncharacterized membrane protein